MRPSLLLLPLVFLLGLFAGVRLAGWGADETGKPLVPPVEAASAPNTGTANVLRAWQAGERASVLELEPSLRAVPSPAPEVERGENADYRDEDNRDLVNELGKDGPEVRGHYDSGALRFEAQRSFIGDEWVLDGKWSSWYENGQREELGAYKSGAEVGLWEWWYDDGKPMASGTFLAGERQGPWSFWYANGNRKMDATYVDGEGEGHWILYHEDGFKWAEGEYLAGEISGAWNIWNADGSLNHERSGVYENGAKVSD